MFLAKRKREEELELCRAARVCSKGGFEEVGALLRQLLSGRTVKMVEKLGKVDAGDFFIQDNVNWIIKEVIHFGKELF